MSTSTLFQLARALVLTSALVSTALGQQSAKTQVAVTMDSQTFTAVESYGDVVLVDGSTSATIEPGQHTSFAGVSISAVPERTAIVVEGSQTYGFTHPLSTESSGGVAPTPTPVAGALPAAVITGSSGESVTVSAIPSSYVIEGASTTTTIAAGDSATVAGAQISALSSSAGVVADSFTFTLSAASSMANSTGSTIPTLGSTNSADTTLITGTNTDTTSIGATTSPPSGSSTAATDGSSDSSSSSSSTGGAVTFTTGDLGIVGWLASSIGMLMFAFGL